MTPEWVQGVAAIATFFAAGLAVWAAFRGPELAAQFAEKLRVQNQASEQIRTAKLNVFATPNAESIRDCESK